MSSIGKIRRILDLLEHLQSGRVHNATQLAGLCGVSRRTLFRDLKVLQESGVPILYDAAKEGYWLPQSAFLPPTDFTLAESLALMILAQELAGETRAIPFQKPARDAVLKLMSNLPGELRQHVGETAEHVQIFTEAQPDLQGQRKHYELMLKAVQVRRRVRMQYDSFAERSEIKTLLSPYRLFFLRRSWYVIGRSSLHRAVRTFHIGRVVESELTDDEYEVPPRFTLKRYFGNAWSMIRERGKRQLVTIRFQPLVARNIAEVVWHATQRLEWNDDGTLDFHVEVDGLREIVWWILGYGKEAEVLQPASLRDMVAQHVATLANKYDVSLSQQIAKRRKKQTKSKRSRKSN